MSAFAASRPVAANDLIGLMLLVAATLHGLVILGVVFNPEERSKLSLPSMEIILVHHASAKAPDQADYLAQANLQGGGEHTEKERPRNPASTPTALPNAGDAPQVVAAAAPPTPPPPPRQAMVARRVAEPRAAPPPPRPVTPAPRRKLPAADLLRRQREIARLTAEISQMRTAYAKRPRRKWIMANTREHRHAAYMEAWRMKVERVGNLNYPGEAKRRSLHGSPVVEVAVNADGTLNFSRIQKSSGFRVLDDAALRIVQLSAPFAPLAETVRQDTDILHIIRTWRFKSDNRFSTR